MCLISIKKIQNVGCDIEIKYLEVQKLNLVVIDATAQAAFK